MLFLPLNAQIIIKDTVVISPNRLIGPDGFPYSPMTDSLFIAPRSGALGIIPYRAHKYRSPLPAGTYLSIEVSDSTYTPQILPFLPYLDSSDISGDSCQFHLNRVLYYHEWNQIPTDTFYTKAVQEGDTVRFSMHGAFYSPSVYIYYDGYSNHGEVRMEAQRPPGCVGYYVPDEDATLYLFFADTLVKITRPDSAVVYPYYPGRNDTITVGPQKRFIDLELKVEFADAPIPNRWVRLDRPVLVDSGGHSHDGSRPMGQYKYPITSGTLKDTILAKTDSTGRVRFRYFASQFGGVERIRARLVSDTTKWDTLSLITRVPGLERLPDGANYDLVGGTCEHHGPGGGGSCETPDNNHYAAQLVRDSLPLMANKWVDSLGQAALFINDISLLYGGLFDVSGHWVPEHSEHREGLDVDVRTERPGRLGVEDVMRRENGKEMTYLSVLQEHMASRRSTDTRREQMKNIII